MLTLAQKNVTSKRFSFFHSILTPSLAEMSQLAGKKCPVGVCIGNFDGMHLGHQAIFSRLFLELGENSYRVLITFDPHPRVVVGPVSKRAVTCITPLRAKIALANIMGFDAVYVIKFTKQIAELEPEAFIEEYFSRRIKPSVIVVGSDWCFGKGRKGRVDTLQNLSAKYGFRVVVLDDVCGQDEVRLSSRTIREYLHTGNLKAVSEALGRDFSVYLRVVPGEGRGRVLGFHTANLAIDNQALPPNGVYAVRAKIAGKEAVYLGVANIGVRPTFSETRRCLEVHLLDYQGGNFYGEFLQVEFVEYLRAEQKFSGVSELKGQIELDIGRAREVFVS